MATPSTFGSMVKWIDLSSASLRTRRSPTLSGRQEGEAAAEEAAAEAEDAEDADDDADGAGGGGAERGGAVPPTAADTAAPAAAADVSTAAGFFAGVLQAYLAALPASDAREVAARFEAVRRRGRKRLAFG
jgi:hypothetical protein